MLSRHDAEQAVYSRTWTRHGLYEAACPLALPSTQVPSPVTLWGWQLHHPVIRPFWACREGAQSHWHCSRAKTHLWAKSQQPHYLHVCLAWHHTGRGCHTSTKHASSGRRSARGRQSLQRRIALAPTCLGLLELCAPRAGLSLLQEWPRAPAWHGWAQAGLTLFLQLKQGTASVWEAVSLEHCIDSSFPVSKCYSFTSKDYASLSALYWAYCRLSFLEKKKKSTVECSVFLFLSNI